MASGAEGAWVDHYATLGLTVAAATATAEGQVDGGDEAALPTRREISKAFRRLALALHPDKQPAGLSEADRKAVAAKFEAVSLANEVLQNDELREAYDVQYRARMKEALRRQKLDAKSRAMELDLVARERAAREGEKQARAAHDAALQTAQWIQSEDAAFKRKTLDALAETSRSAHDSMPLHSSSSSSSSRHASTLSAASKKEIDHYAKLFRTYEDEILAALEAA
ncbi:DnaJ family protein [Hondaea fermentalgiana]|uniref:DnaJ family protein n=1 Tax=Hondaea fermentalgiana TaxID=2315210 RepID=A0A2R5GDS6_9STRA|nr:DnaJ family protein [Hondaea fermentalgiana]|eukprot:GBG26361.1 DnaJ family protein [Hondaea fermentalgiana]